MQRWHTGIRIVVLAIALLEGCAPAIFTDVPQISGRVIEATGKPAPSAIVVLTDAMNPGSATEMTIPCNPDGTFLRQAETYWGLWIAIDDNFGSRFKAVAFAHGSRSAPKTFGSDWRQVRILGLGPVDAVALGDIPIGKPSRSP